MSNPQTRPVEPAPAPGAPAPASPLRLTGEAGAPNDRPGVPGGSSRPVAAAPSPPVGGGEGARPGRSRALTPAEAVGITGNEQPLTDADIHLAAHDRIDRYRDQPDLPPQSWRRPDTGAAWSEFSCMTDNRGIWVRIPGPEPRAGHITWAVAEQAVFADVQLDLLAVSA